jgi:hypothetical protein
MSHETDIRRRDLLAAAGVMAGIAGFGLAESLSAAEKSAGATPRKFHHVGIPTDKKRENERYLAEAKVYITDPAADPFRIEWCRWMPDSPAAAKLKTWPHLAFQVEDCEAEIAKYEPSKVFAKPFVPFEGVKVGFIEHEGFLIEFLEVTKKG